MTANSDAADAFDVLTALAVRQAMDRTTTIAFPVVQLPAPKTPGDGPGGIPPAGGEPLGAAGRDPHDANPPLALRARPAVISRGQHCRPAPVALARVTSGPWPLIAILAAQAALSLRLVWSN